MQRCKRMSDVYNVMDLINIDEYIYVCLSEVSVCVCVCEYVTARTVP